MQICILTPGALGSNPRVVKEADALAEAGHQVTVISTRTLSLVDPLDDAILASNDWRAERLDFRSRGIGWKVLRVTQLAQATAFSLTGSYVFAGGAISPFTASLTAMAKSVPADLYIAHYPAALPAAAMAARVHNVRYAYDAEDFHLGEWPHGPEFEPRRRLYRSIESRYLAGCAFVTAASPGIADAYVEIYGISRPSVLLNVFPCALSPRAPTSAGVVLPRPSVYWFSQTIGPDRGIETAVEAIGLARSGPHLYLRGAIASEFAKKLHAIAADAHAADRLHFLSSESPIEMVRLAAEYDLGLSSETGCTLNRRIALNNKLFTYLLAGVPVLLSDVPAHQDFAMQAGHAVKLYATDNSKSLARAIDEFLESPAMLARARLAAFDLARERFNWEIEKLALLDCVAKATGVPAAVEFSRTARMLRGSAPPVSR